MEQSELNVCVLGENGDVIVQVFESRHYVIMTVRVPETECLAAVKLTATQAHMVAMALEKVPDDLISTDAEPA
jgi:hypothetical protein